MSRIRPGGWAWIGLASGITITDIGLIVAKKETMSEIFGTALLHPIKRWPVIAAWSIVTLHLFGNLLPPFCRILKRLDPISGSAQLVSNLLKRS